MFAQKTVWLCLTLLSICCAATGQILFKMGVRSMSFSIGKLGSIGAIAKTLANPYVASGLAFFAVGTILWLAVISGKQLSSVYPMVSLGYILITVASIALFGDSISLFKALGMIFILTGVLLINTQPNDERPVSAACGARVFASAPDTPHACDNNPLAARSAQSER